MKIKADLLRVKVRQFNDINEKVEPEQQTVQRVLQTDAEVSLNTARNKTVGLINSEIVYETTAGEMARAMRHPCFSCKNFNKRAWRELFVSMAADTAPMEKRQELNNIRAALLTTKNAKLQDRHVSQEGDMDVEHAISQLGICMPLTEIHGEPVVVHPTGGCPPEVCGATNPDGFYKSKDLDADKMGSKTFDNVMRLAQGQRGL